VAQGPEGISLALIIDNSGSMADTDPGNLRFAAASQLIDLLESGDEITVITFADESTVLIPLTKVTDEESKALIKQGLTPAAPGGNTNMGPGLQDGLAQLEQGSNSIRFAIFLTDGQLHPPGWNSLSPEEQDAERNSVLELASQFAEAESTLFTVSLATTAEPEFLQTLAGNGGGLYREAPEAARLTLVFQEIFAAEKLDEFEVLFDDCLAPGEQRVVSFSVHQFLDTLSLFVTYSDDLRPAVTVVRPDGAPQAPAGGDSRYDTFNIDAPMAGTWTVTAVGAAQGESCITISSTPRALVEVEWILPTASHQQAPGEPLQVRVALILRDSETGQERPLEDADVSVTVTGPDDQPLQGDLQHTGAGQYEGEVPISDVEGEYSIGLLVQAGDLVVARRSLEVAISIAAPAVPSPAVPSPTAVPVATPQPTDEPTVAPVGPVGPDTDGGGLPLTLLFLAPLFVVGIAISIGAYNRFGQPVLRGFIVSIPQGRVYELESIHRRMRWRKPLTIGGPQDDIDLGAGKRLARVIPQKNGEPLLEVLSDSDDVAVNNRPLQLGQRWRLLDQSEMRFGSVDLVYHRHLGAWSLRPQGTINRPVIS
jgi:hypothetical protein